MYIYIHKLLSTVSIYKHVFYKFYTYYAQLHTKALYIYLTYMYPILEYSITYLILEYYA